MSRDTALIPVGETISIAERTLSADVVRWETYDDMKAAMNAKGWRKSAFRRLEEYAAQYLGEVVDEKTGESEWLTAPRWFRAWRRFARWIDDAETAPRPDFVRMSFGFPTVGFNCNERNLRTGRVFFLKDSAGRRFVAIMAVSASDPAWAEWLEIERGWVLPGAERMDRLLIDPRGGLSWSAVDASIISELVTNRKLCLFEMAADPVFDAVTNPLLNQAERFAHISTDFVFCARPQNGGFGFFLRWGVTYNPGMSRYPGVDRTKVLSLDVALRRGYSWAERPINVSDPSDADAAAREAVMRDGCILLPRGASEELRRAIMRALFFVTFPDRRPDEPGGLLRGYQLPGRMVRRADGPVRNDNTAKLVSHARTMGRARTDARRKIVVDTLLGRAARALAARNGLDESEALGRIELSGGREILTAAAQKLGMMDGNSLVLFTPKPTAGALKLPDLSLAFAFEQLLGLNGPGDAAMAAIVQTARVRPLAETPTSLRIAVPVVATATRMWQPTRGRENVPVSVSSTHPPRVIRDEGRYYLLAVPKSAGAFRYDRDLAYDAGGTNRSVPVSVYSFRSSKGERSRESVELIVETFDWQKIVNMARLGRMLLYALDFGSARRWADAAYLPSNSGPCAFSTTMPRIVSSGSTVSPRASDEVAAVRLTFIANPTIHRDNRKWGVRSLSAYLDAYPDARTRPLVVFDPASPEDSALEVVRRDALLVVKREDSDIALAAMSYVVVPGRGLREPGGLHNGYMLIDRVFANDVTDDARGRDPRKGRRLVEVVSKEKAAVLEKHFAALIAADGVVDRKSARRFSLDKPISITPELAPAVAREFRRVVFTGTMDARRQLVRPAHEVAVGIWLMGLAAVR